jgi:hypothetical protein
MGAKGANGVVLQTVPILLVGRPASVMDNQPTEEMNVVRSFGLLELPCPQDRRLAMKEGIVGQAS